MSLLKWTGKYTLIGLLVLVVIITISVLLFSQRGQKVAESPRVSPDTPSQSPPPSGIKSPSGGHFHADGSWHADPPTQGNRNGNAVSKGSAQNSGTPRTKTSSRNDKSNNRSSLGWITWKNGHASGLSRSPYRPGFLLIPQEVFDKINALAGRRTVRKRLQDELVEKGATLEEAIETVRRVHYGYNGAWPPPADMLDELGRPLPREIPQGDLLDKKGKPLPLITDEEYEEERLKILVGGRDLEEATQFLEAHGRYEELHLSKLDDKRAFEYLYAIESRVRTFGPNDTPLARVYAERVVASYSDNLQARLYLADTSPRASLSDFESALAQYESILVDHPESPHALVEAGTALIQLERPVQAIEYFKRGQELGAAQGFFEAGIAYQQLGDYKTAWVHLCKASSMPDAHGRFAVHEHLDAIEAGQPVIKPLPIEKLDFPETGSLPASDPDSLFGSTGELDPFMPSAVGFSDAEAGAAYQRAEAESRAKAAAARREEIALMRQMSDQEIDDFIQWAEQLMREEAAAARATDFLAQEMAAHLTGGPAQFSPERIVRANEIVQQYGTKEGLQRLKISDPEIAVQIQLLQNQEPIPTIKD